MRIILSTERFLAVCLNPTLQKTIILPRLWENEVNRSVEHFLDASGKGVNVSRVLTQLGEEAVHLTQAGGRNRELFIELAEKGGAIIRWVDSKSEIRYCYTLINQANHTATEIVEEAFPVSDETETKIFEQYQYLLPQCHTVIISGTKAPNFSGRLYPEMVREAKQQGKQVILDLKGADLINSLPNRPDFIKPNLAEFAATFFEDCAFREADGPGENLAAIEAKLAEIYRQYGTISILTNGKHGVLLCDGEKTERIAAPELEPVNTIGCGDAFTAGFARAWHHNPDLSSAVAQGMKCARLNALSVHPGVIK
jgi:1-phosphofructokinase family hexose kinase